MQKLAEATVGASNMLSRQLVHEDSFHWESVEFWGRLTKDPKGFGLGKMRPLMSRLRFRGFRVPTFWQEGCVCYLCSVAQDQRVFMWTIADAD